MIIKIFWIYTLICLVESFILKWAVDTGRWAKLEDEKFGDDAWRNRITQYIPDNQGLAIICIFFAFFIGNPIFIFTLIKNLFK